MTIAAPMKKSEQVNFSNWDIYDSLDSDLVEHNLKVMPITCDSICQ